LKLNSIPFVFNFGYRNRAPLIIDLNQYIIGDINFELLSITYEPAEISFRIYKNTQYNGRIISEDLEILDNLTAPLYYIEPIIPFPAGGKLEIEEGGKINIRSDEIGDYEYKIIISDRETNRTFITKIKVE